MYQHPMAGIGFWWMSLGALLASSGYAVADKAMTLVKDGSPRCTVVLGANASIVERHAAHELRTYFRKVSGADIPQVETIGDGVKGLPIVLGTPESCPAIGTAGLLPGLRELSSEGFLIRADAKEVFIAAKRPIGVLYGVYTFLEDMYRKYYGPAAEEMKRYRELLARTWETAPGHFIYGTPSPHVGKCLAQPGREQELLKHLKDAERAAAADAVCRDRVGREKRYFHAIWRQALADWAKMTSVEATNVRRREGPIAIDGILQEADWGAAPSTTGFINSNTGKPAAAQTFVKLLCDEDYLYLGVVALEPSPEKMAIQSTKRDEPVWKDDDLEFFIDPEGTARTYYHFAVNPKGAVYDAKCVPGSFDTGCNADCEVACKALSDRWVLEMKIKASSLNAAIRHGGIWKLNVARSRRPDGGEGSSWSADGSFHQPAGFRPIVFGHRPDAVPVRQECGRGPSVHWDGQHWQDATHFRVETVRL